MTEVSKPAFLKEAVSATSSALAALPFKFPLSNPHPDLETSIIIPARNEEEHLFDSLTALATQANSSKTPYDFRSFEVILLINNSTDQSLEVARKVAAIHPALQLHIVEQNFSQDVHIGQVRRALTDIAFERLWRLGRPKGLILSTDADTEVASDWVCCNRKAIAAGADAVGGVIRLHARSAKHLPALTQSIQGHYDRYRTLIARCEDIYDPMEHDRWPRHYHHFGSSLGVTAEAYRKVGGLPPEPLLEDLAFYRSLLRHDANFRHSPDVIVYTSARLSGRVAVGLSEQLSRWTREEKDLAELQVEDPKLILDRFVLRRNLRAFWKRRSRSTSDAVSRMASQSLLPIETIALMLESEFFGAAWERIEHKLPPFASTPIKEAIAYLEGILTEALRGELENVDSVLLTTQ